LGLRAGRCSPDDPVRSGAVEAGVLTGVQLERRQRKGVDWLGRWLLCVRLESMVAGDFKATSSPAACG
jgi:hypothetical protein